MEMFIFSVFYEFSSLSSVLEEKQHRFLPSLKALKEMPASRYTAVRSFLDPIGRNGEEIEIRSKRTKRSEEMN